MQNEEPGTDLKTETEIERERSPKIVKKMQ